LVEGLNKPLFSEVLSKQVDTKFSQVNADISKVQQVVDDTKKMAEEEKDRENRSNNIVIYRVPECKEGDDRLKHDKALCIELLRDVLEIDSQEEDLKAVFRLGKKGQDQVPNSRPILVQFREKVTKNRVLESLFKLKNAEEKFKKVSITQDMTIKERAECKSLVEEAKKKESEEAGEYIFRV